MTSSGRLLPAPPLDPAEAAGWVTRELAGLHRGAMAVSDIRGGQAAADAALARFDVRGYASRRNEVWPIDRRGASGLSPYIRHGLLPLRRVWDAVTDRGGADDVAKFRDELMWQEYARHVYARLGGVTRRSLRFSVVEHGGAGANAWVNDMACLAQAWTELTSRGWLPNQARMWMASHWTVRHRLGWRDGEDLFFRHLVDGSRAANRLGWQWTVGALTGKPYGFSRWQVEKRAPGMCRDCSLARSCPIEDWPPTSDLHPRSVGDGRVRRDPDLAQTRGPIGPQVVGTPEAVWITGESLGDDDPALSAHPDLPAVFVFDEGLLATLRLAPLRLVFLAETLADLATRRAVEVWRGHPDMVLGDRPVAATFSPVPGWRRRAERIRPVDTRPWPWLVEPGAGPLTSFTAWVRSSRTP